ncbi:MAG: hypothetical protein WBG08_12315 [Litorimonas sp.]
MIWVHADALSSAHPVFREAPEGARAVFVWDAAELARRDWSLKRCVFVLECLAEMEVELVEGDPVAVLEATGAQTIYTAATPDPYVRDVVGRLTAQVRTVRDVHFASIPDSADMKRFFRYWNKAKKSVLTRSEDTP